jgi:H+/Cl- antiporter ClcA
MPARIFVLEMTYLVLLIALLIIYKSDHALRHDLHPLGVLPAQIAWFGAVGGVFAGLRGIYYHNENWKHSYDYWHYSRPLVGGILGGIGCLLFYVTLTVGSTKAVTPNTATFDAVAFILAYADRTFEMLITKVTQLLFGPGDSSAPDR